MGLNFDLSKEKMDRCLKDSDAQDMILEHRIEAQRKYKIDYCKKEFRPEFSNW